MTDKSENIVVSICSITFNHAPYIRECLDGFLMQQCDFDFEVLIHDDASTDGTAEIIKEYQEKYPDIIKPILQIENQWSQGIRNIQSLYNFSRAKGKYIAMCEGDDYWTDPHKLQKQVDFLEANEEFGSCFTLYKIFFENKKVFEDAPKPILRAINKEFNGQVLTIDDFTKDWYTQILTILVEKDLLTSIDLSGYKYARDNHICYHLLKSKKSICLNELTSIYRKHEKGVFSGISHKINYEQHYLIYEELYLNNRNDDNLYKFCMRMLDELIKNYHLIDLFEFWNKIQMKEAKLKLFFIYPKSQKLKFFNKINLGDKLLIIKEYFYRYVKTII